MNKNITLAICGTAFALGSLGALAAPAGAHHQHYIETPQGTQIVLPCEPEGTAAYDLHPRHTRLHMGPSMEERAITIAKIASCSDPLPNGPAGD